MKKVILLIFFVSVSIISFGNTPANFKDDNCTLKNKLEKQLRLPDYLKKKSNAGTVKVEFVINENDAIEIKNISGKNDEIIANEAWITKKQQGYSISYISTDKENIDAYSQLIENGMVSATLFFNSAFKNEFKVYVHPDRISLDSTWQKYFNMPEFKSECWMVASGDATKLDMISPKSWNIYSCEHDFNNKIKIQQLITHELIHVYHGQLNPSPDFSAVEGIDWLVEGIATYASGQCDSIRMIEVKKAIKENNIPDKLDDFWTGKLKYGLSGSFLMYIDYKYGRSKLKELLQVTKKSEVLSLLNISESKLLNDWKEYMNKL